jgi:hypothetical protein
LSRDSTQVAATEEPPPLSPPGEHHPPSRYTAHVVANMALNYFVLAVATHSVVVGLCLLCFPMWTLKMVGWQYDGEVFWPSQAGLFLIILGSAYAAAIRYRPLIWLLIFSKFSAIAFLIAHVLFLDAPKLVALLGAGDGAMGLIVGLLFWYAERTKDDT